MATRRTQRIVAVLEGLALAYLLLLLTLYGVSKLALAQFFTRLSWLDARVVQLGEFELTWTFYSQSAAYQFFAGCVETGLALLLLVKRTRKLGALLAVPVFLHLVALNIGFELGALDDALSGLVPSVGLTLLYLKEYKAFFWDETGTLTRQPPPFGPGAMRAATGAKYVVAVTGLVATLLVIRLKLGLFDTSELYGTWRVESAVADGGGGGVPSDLAPGSVVYFENSRDVVVRAEDSFYHGSYRADPQKREIRLALYNVDLRDYNELSLGNVAKERYFNPKNLRHSLSGSYGLDSAGALTICIAFPSDAGRLTLVLRPVTAAQGGRTRATSPQ
jgi:hypothetical protein